MTFRYILRSFRRRKVRTLIMLLSLMFGVGLVVSMSAMVDTNRQFAVETIAQMTGGYDLAIRKADTAADPFIQIDSISRQVRRAAPEVREVIPRFDGTVEASRGSRTTTATFAAFDPKNDSLARLKVISGTADIGPGRVVVLPATAGALDIKVGDKIDLYYTLPIPRREGYAGSVGASSSRLHTTATVVGIATQRRLMSRNVPSAIIGDLGFTQSWLGLQGRASTLLVQWDPAIYSTADPNAAVAGADRITSQVWAALGDDYTYDMSKVQSIDQNQSAFSSQQTAINIYGLMALGIVGLLVRTLMQNNVAENRRDLAVLRILGATGRRLAGTVIVEAAVLGVAGAILGVVGGILLNNLVVAPILARNMLDLGDVSLQPTVSPGSIWPAVLMAAGVLAVSALGPARQASTTKVMYAINPGAANNIGLDDIVKFRERRASGRVFIIGLSIVFAWLVIYVGSGFAYATGDASVQTGLNFSLMLAMVIGMAMMFSVLAVPLERLLLTILDWISPKRAFFVTRYVRRSKERNSWISLMIVLAATLPMLLATQGALSDANMETLIRLQDGTPLNAVVDATGPAEAPIRAKPAVMKEVQAVPGIERVVGMTTAYHAKTASLTGLRSAQVYFAGLTGNLDGILYPDLVKFWGSGPEAFARIQEKNTVIISSGLAQHLQVDLGDKVRVTGKGLDHTVDLTVVGIGIQVAGFSPIRPSQNYARSGQSAALVSFDTWREINHDPIQGTRPLDDPVMMRFWCELTPGASPTKVGSALRSAFSVKYNMRVLVVEEEMASTMAMIKQLRLLMVGMTIISFVTAILSVFAVIYVAVHSRRVEIGMLKAIGSPESHLLLTFMLEAVVMSVSAVLAGIVSGALLGYLNEYSLALMNQRPTTFAVDTQISPLIVTLVVAASIVSALLASRGMLKRSAVEILRDAQ